ncbi:MAG: hypothetical protein BYD32DRAFT_430242 [Podila humilis]|nr:MAG: hypothetical protein BYD32DRAFT_430242 [Podila humilis]
MIVISICVLLSPHSCSHTIVTPNKHYQLYTLTSHHLPTINNHSYSEPTKPRKSAASSTPLSSSSSQPNTTESVMIDNDELDLSGNHNQAIQSEIERKATSLGDPSTIGEQWNDI